ncbi:HNH endonuclease [Psychromonas sp. SR45-3]|uniref:HNH endonuclease n=1 Tax=Psychromonas sp. SR45-3 TaxID=2760930 RepID=UPI0015FD07D5|nr:HNH endonuclease [Psychromonas sp. SR45-3]MBB1274551.1 HNH endonuclease [Psychromonas sp. SR45-3]
MMNNQGLKHYESYRDDEIRFEYSGGYGKHNKKVILTVYECEPVAEVYLDDHIFMLIDAGSLYLLESNAFIAHKRNDGQFCGRANGASRSYIHRLILMPPTNLQIDHINHNPLDNRIKNLRECSAKQNNIAKRNSRVNDTIDTALIGVVHVNKLLDEDVEIYKVRHPVEGVFPKSFNCEWEAGEYRDEIISDYFLTEYHGGEWSTLNFINWNFPPCEAVEDEVKAYENYMEYHCQSMREDSVKWLSQQSWTKSFYDCFMLKWDDKLTAH